MLLPEHIEHLNNPFSAALGTCDLALNPLFTRVWGVKAGPAADTIQFMVPGVIAALPMAHIRENPQAALNVNSQIDDYTLQFKGKITGIQASTPEDDAFAESTLYKLCEFTRAFSEDMADKAMRWIVSPGYIFTLHVEEIYNQTPGPDAGRRLFRTHRNPCRKT